MRLLPVWSFLVLAILLTPAREARAGADGSCALQELADLEGVMAPQIGLLVSVRVEDQPELMLLDTGGVVSKLSDGAITRLHLSRRYPSSDPFHPSGAEFRVTNIAGVAIKAYVLAHSLRLGGVEVGPAYLADWPNPAPPTQQPAGLLGPDLLRRFDVELDFTTNHARLFAPDHCPGRVVYWAKSYARVPLRVASSGHLHLAMTLDGRTVDAVLDTGAPTSLMSLRAAAEKFGLESNSAGVEPVVGDPRDPLKRYRYAFKSLSIAGLDIRNPAIDMIRDQIYRAPDKWEASRHELDDEEKRLPDLILGMSVLTKLRLYIAYREQALYFTTADAK